MITAITEALQFEFFVRALAAGSILALVCSLLGTFVVVRKEVMVAHTVSNMAFLGIVLAVLIGFEMNIGILGASLLGVGTIAWLQRSPYFSRSSVLEFSSQIAMALAIVGISQMSGYRVDLLQFLFGDILAITKGDLLFTIVLAVIVLGTLLVMKKPLMQIVLNEELALSAGTKVGRVNLIYLALVALTVAIGLKIIGVILLAAFLVIPANVGKVVANSFGGLVLWAMTFGVTGTIIGLFLAYSWNVPSGAMIVVTMGIFLFLAMAVKKIMARKVA